MTWIADVMERGWSPRQHHEPFYPPESRLVTFSCRVVPSDEPEEAWAVEDGSVGDDIGWAFWPERTDKRKCGAWSVAFAAVVAGADGPTKAGGTSSKRSRYFLHPDAGGGIEDDRFEAKDPVGADMLPVWSQRFPTGWTGIVGAGTEEDAESLAFHPDFLGVVANNRGSMGFSTKVFDLDGGEINTDLAADASTIWSVENVISSRVTGLQTGPHVAWQIGQTGQEDHNGAGLMRAGRDVLCASSGVGGPFTTPSALSQRDIGSVMGGQKVWPLAFTSDTLWRGGRNAGVDQTGPLNGWTSLGLITPVNANVVQSASPCTINWEPLEQAWRIWAHVPYVETYPIPPLADPGVTRTRPQVGTTAPAPAPAPAPPGQGRNPIPQDLGPRPAGSGPIAGGGVRVNKRSPLDGFGIPGPGGTGGGGGSGGGGPGGVNPGAGDALTGGLSREEVARRTRLDQQQRAARAKRAKAKADAKRNNKRRERDAARRAKHQARRDARKASKGRTQKERLERARAKKAKAKADREARKAAQKEARDARREARRQAQRDRYARGTKKNKEKGRKGKRGRFGVSGRRDVGGGGARGIRLGGGLPAPTGGRNPLGGFGLPGSSLVGGGRAGNAIGLGIAGVGATLIGQGQHADAGGTRFTGYLDSGSGVRFYGSAWRAGEVDTTRVRVGDMGANDLASVVAAPQVGKFVAYGVNDLGGWDTAVYTDRQNRKGDGSITLVPACYDLGAVFRGETVAAPDTAVNLLLGSDLSQLSFGTPDPSSIRFHSGVRMSSSGGVFTSEYVNSLGATVGINYLVAEGGHFFHGKVTMNGRLDPWTVEFTDRTGSDIPAAAQGFRFDSAVSATRPLWSEGNPQNTHQIAFLSDVGGAPTAHAASHVAGDAIQSATSGQIGLMTTAFASKLDGIEALAEVNPAVVSQADAEAGTATDERIWTAERVKQAIVALETTGTGDVESTETSATAGPTGSQTWTIPAGKLAADGDFVKFMGGCVSAGAGGSSVAFAVGGVTLRTVPSAVTQSAVFQLQIVRTGATAGFLAFSVVDDGGGVRALCLATTLTWANAQTIVITSANASNYSGVLLYGPDA